MHPVIHDLTVNLKSGARLCRFARPGLEAFRVTTDQLVLLLLVGVSIGFGIDYLGSLPQPEFNSHALTIEGFDIAALLLGVYLVSRFVSHREDILAIPVLILSTTPLFLIAWELLGWLVLDRTESGVMQSAVSTAYMLWWLAVIFLCLRMALGRGVARVLGAFTILLVSWLLPVWYLASYNTFWYPAEEDSGEDPYAAYRELDAEQLFYRQPDLLDSTLTGMAAERPGVKDVYFLGVGAYARQDVFLKEALYATQLFEERFDSRGRSLVLINHLSTHDEVPLATSTNLKRALNHIGSLMNPEEDVMMLYMTSHGSRDHKFSMDFWPLPLNDITPEMLSEYLDEAGIKWRVVMISACYSGGFLPTLRNPYTAFASASARDRESFGCSNENDFTYFGEALLKDQLLVSHSIPASFSNAMEAINWRETAEKLEPSDPQFYVGDEIASLLDTLTVELPERLASPPLTGSLPGAHNAAISAAPVAAEPAP